MTATKSVISVLKEESEEQESPVIMEHSPTFLMNDSAIIGHSPTFLLNDFVIEDSVDDLSAGTKSMNFDFGVYLEYWRRDRKNSVIPKYSNLKEEVMKNQYWTITEQQYVNLREKCQKYLIPMSLAKDIGIGNKICKIPPGSPITIDHFVALKLYTDFTDLQREFKRHCRRLRKGESVEDVMERNREIAHWSRLLRESIMFWGQSMKTKHIFYCGLTARLVLRSLSQRFECPLSTTSQFTVAQQFTDDSDGIILKIKRANGRTRYFDMVRISAFGNEFERLFIGSTIKIIGILAYNAVRGKWESLKPRYFVSALAMFEQIYNGHFVDGKPEARALLLKLLQSVYDDNATKCI